jgi:hypothetical protein
MKTRNAAETCDPGKLLRQRLGAPMPVERFAIESLQETIGRVHQSVLPLADVPVGELLLSPRTELAALVTLGEENLQGPCPTLNSNVTTASARFLPMLRPADRRCAAPIAANRSRSRSPAPRCRR